jgi:hypothetical protein
VEAVAKPIRRITLQTAAPVFDFPDPGAAVVEERKQNQTLEALAKLGNYWLVQTNKGGMGWLCWAPSS